MTLAIRLDNVSKRYWKLEEQAMLLRSLLPFRRPTRSEFWALRDVSLTIERGETLGVVGRNGAGKTTMLRMLAGVTQPTAGEVSIAGRVAPLISVGVGFRQEMSGRENVFVNGMLLGLRKQEVIDRFDSIVDFAELGDFIDTPVKFYSSGMFMRLGFSVAVHTQPDVFLVDEVLAVGDSAFQLKCFNRMSELQQTGTTIVIVSHSLHAIRLLCPRTILMRKGTVEFDGPTEQAIAAHQKFLAIDSEEQATSSNGPHATQGAVRVVESTLVGPEGPLHYTRAGVPAELRLRLQFDEPVESPMVAIEITDQRGMVVCGTSSPLAASYRSYAPGDQAEAVVRFDIRLGGGSYRVFPKIMTADGASILWNEANGIPFYVEQREWSYGSSDIEARFAVDAVELTEKREFRFGGRSDEARS